MRRIAVRTMVMLGTLAVGICMLPSEASAAPAPIPPEATVLVPYDYTGLIGFGTSCSMSGSLPPGLVIDPTTNEVTGTPTTAGTFTFSVQCSGGANSGDLSIDVNPADLGVQHALLGQPYEFDGLVGIDSGATCTLSLGDDPPAGLSFNPVTHVISGTPTKTGSPASMTMACGAGEIAQANFDIQVDVAAETPLASPGVAAAYLACAGGIWFVVRRVRRRTAD